MVGGVQAPTRWVGVAKRAVYTGFDRHIVYYGSSKECGCHEGLIVKEAAAPETREAKEQRLSLTRTRSCQKAIEKSDKSEQAAFQPPYHRQNSSSFASMPTDAHIAHIRSRQDKGKGPAGPSQRTITLLVLLADTPIETVRNKLGYKSYHDVFCSLFQRSLDTVDGASVELLVKSYDVVNEPWEYPSQQELATASGILITGSGEYGQASRAHISFRRELG